MMTGKIVNATNHDSVRVEVLGESRAVTIPASFLLAADRVLRRTFDAGGMLVWKLDDGWHAATAMKEATGKGETPWGAVVALADALEGR